MSLFTTTRRRRSTQAFIGLAASTAIFAGTSVPANAATPSEFGAAHEGGHSTQMEWWYITGHLTGVDPSGNVRNYGIQSTFFKNHPAWQLDGYSMKMAVTDLNRNTYTQGNKNSVGFFSNPSGGGFNASIDNWVLKGKDGYNTVSGNVNWGDYVLDLKTTPKKAPTVHGGDGYVKFPPFGDTGYYSFTDLGVTGTVIDHGVKVTLTGGQAWLDHQWFNGGTKAGWDWYSIQLNDGTQYMVFLVKGPDGTYSTKFGTMTRPNGSSVELDGSQLSMTPRGSWTSPRSGQTYSSGWNLNVPGGTMIVTPKQLDQESNLALPKIDYWEGATTVSGTAGGKSVSGQGFTEITPVQCLCGF